MKRLILFAHFDKDNIVDDYVIRLLEGFKPHYDRLVFVSDSDLGEEEQDKIRPFGEIAHAAHHGEYDFGSWKRAFQYVGDDIHEFDEAIIVNDSCFGPLYDFSEMFDKMDQNDCDFWGVTGTIIKRINQYCINNYIMSFRKPIFSNNRFQEFWKNITKLGDKLEIVGKYEFGLSDLLFEEGYKGEAYCGWYDTDIMVTSAFFPKVWLKKRCPIVKVKVFRSNLEEVPHVGQWLEKLGTSYPRSLIDNLVKRYIGTTDPAHYYFKYPLFKHYYGHRKLFAVKACYTKNKKWWRFHIKLLGIYIFMIWLPSKRPQGL